MRFKFVSLFGDGQPHPPMEQIRFSAVLFKVPLRQAEKIILNGLRDGFIEWAETDRIRNIKASGDYVIPWFYYNLIISKKGDECLRMEQIARGGDYSYYKNYDRSIHGDHGVSKYAPTPKNAFRNL